MRIENLDFIVRESKIFFFPLIYVFCCKHVEEILSRQAICRRKKKKKTGEGVNCRRACVIEIEIRTKKCE